jgi:hypothetical protein
MGANAVTTVPVYASGEVLTAADLNITNSGIPVFATTVTRDAAFGGTGEKTLAEGQFAYIEATNTTQYYDGATWQSVGVTPGLVCVKAETAFSAASSVTADSVFTSTYTNYRIVIRYQTSANELAMQFRAATVDTATGYNYQRLQASSSTVDGVQSTSQTSGFVGHSGSGAFWCLTTLEISGVQLAEPTVYQAICSRNNSAYTSPIIVNYYGNQSASTAFDGIKLLVAAGTMTGSYTIYGYSKAV